MASAPWACWHHTRRDSRRTQWLARPVKCSGSESLHGSVSFANLRPPLLDRRGFPLLACRQDLVLRSIDLRLHDFCMAPDEQPDLPTELMRQQGATSLPLVFGNHEE